MTDKQLNLSILKFCGWKRQVVEHNGKIVEWWCAPSGVVVSQPPNCVRDLNVMHAAEKFLNDTQFMRYNGHLGCSGEYGDWWNKNLTHASARIRAENFVKVIKEWEEDETT